MFGGGGSTLHDYSEEEEELGKIYDRVLMKRLISYLRPYRLEVGFIFFFIMGNTIARLVGPYLMQIAIDQHIKPGKQVWERLHFI